MIGWVDRYCIAWATEVAGGVGLGRLPAVLDQTVRSSPEISPEAQAVERALCRLQLESPWRQVVLVHYLERDLTRTQRWQKMGVSERRYRTLLDQSHDYLADCLRAEMLGE